MIKAMYLSDPVWFLQEIREYGGNHGHYLSHGGNCGGEHGGASNEFVEIDGRGIVEILEKLENLPEFELPKKPAKVPLRKPTVKKHNQDDFDKLCAELAASSSAPNASSTTDVETTVAPKRAGERTFAGRR